MSKQTKVRVCVKYIPEPDHLYSKYESYSAVVLSQIWIMLVSVRTSVMSGSHWNAFAHTVYMGEVGVCDFHLIRAPWRASALFLDDALSPAACIQCVCDPDGQNGHSMQTNPIWFQNLGHSLPTNNIWSYMACWRSRCVDQNIFAILNCILFRINQWNSKAWLTFKLRRSLHRYITRSLRSCFASCVLSELVAITSNAFH